MFDRFACAVAHYSGRPLVFLAAVLSVLAWGGTGPLFGYSETWQLVINTATTIVTFLMVFLIQATQNRDGAALQAKLDELIRAIGSANNQFIELDRKPLDEVEAARR